MKFSDLGLAEALLRAVKTQGYDCPTPIQEAVIPALLKGQDVLGTAQTGTGKTASFVLPLLHEIATAPRPAKPKQCGALIVTPTRELAAQIADNVRAYGQFMRVTSTVVIGGARPGPQIKGMARGVDILIATPGRLLDHMGTGVISLAGTRTVVLDEADQMLDLGFLPAIKRIIAAIPNKRRTVLLSATMPKPIRGLAREILKDPVEISVAPVSKPIETIDQRVIHLPKENKRDALIDLLKTENADRAVVFTRTKRGADKVSRILEKSGVPSVAIHGNKSQNQRTRSLDAFKSGKARILVATDIAARGIDIDDISHVINFELPNVPEAYVHRIGRTARAGKSGIAISLCDPEEVSLLRDIERLTRNTIPASGDVPPPAKPKAKAKAKKDAAKRPRKKARPGQAKRKRAANETGGSRNNAPARTRAGASANENPDTGLARMLGV